jgi:hypothetical protein
VRARRAGGSVAGVGLGQRHLVENEEPPWIFRAVDFCDWEQAPRHFRSWATKTTPRVDASTEATVYPLQLMINAKNLPEAHYVDYTFVFN